MRVSFSSAAFTTVFAVLLFSCNSSGTRDVSLMQEATGRPGDMILVMDAAQWRGELGEQVRSIFLRNAQGLPRTEPAFNVKWVAPNKKMTLLNQVRNLVYVFTLDRRSPETNIILERMSEETINQIRDDSTFYISTRQDEFARGQTVMYLFGSTEENLIRHLKASGDGILRYFNDLERNRLIRNLKGSSATNRLTNFLEEQQQLKIRLPRGYKLAQNTDDFVWFRQVEVDADESVFISWKPYTDERQLSKDSIIAWRDNIAKRYLFEDPDSKYTHLVTETSIPWKPVITQTVEFNGRYAVEIRGLWRTNNKTMGGPFVGYTIVDEITGYLYYIEGFTYSPGKDQREIIRELEAILWTFQSNANSGLKE